MVAGELAHLAGEGAAPVGKESFRFAEPPGRTASRRPRNLEVNPEPEIAQRNPARLSAPADMDDLFPVRQQLLEPATVFGAPGFGSATNV
jgi:hypothetical protein